MFTGRESSVRPQGNLTGPIGLQFPDGLSNGPGVQARGADSAFRSATTFCALGRSPIILT